MPEEDRGERVIDYIYIAIADRKLNINQRRYFYENKIGYIPLDCIRIFKNRSSMERFVKKEMLLKALVKVWCIDFETEKIKPIGIEIRKTKEE